MLLLKQLTLAFTFMAFVSFTKNKPCPVCNSGSKGCSVSDDISNPIHMCRGSSINSSFNFIKMDRNNLFGIYIHNDYYKGKDTKSKPDYVAINIAKEEQKILDAQKLQALLSVEERHVKISNLLKSLKLLKKHSKDLKDRNYNDDSSSFVSIRKYQIVTVDCKGLPGFVPSGSFSKYVGTTGMLCPITDVNGNYLGYQIKSDKPNVTGKYVWTKHSDKDHGFDITAHLQTGELPINVLRSDNGSEVGFCEGTLKPIIAAHRLGITLVGEAIVGGQPIQLESTLKTLNPTKCVIYPDAGYVGNKQVLGRVQLLATMIAELGYKVLIADWYHGFNKNLADIDERKDLKDLRYLTLEDIQLLSNPQNESSYFLDSDSTKEIHKLSQQVGKLIKDSQNISQVRKGRKIELENKNYNWQDYDENTLPSHQPNHNLCYEIEENAQLFYQEALKKGYKVVLDISQTGSGKTHDAARMDVTQCFEILPKDTKSIKYFHISQSPRKANNEKLVTDFTLLPSRHVDMSYDNAKLDAAGNPVLVNAKANVIPDVYSNCHLLDYFTSVRSTKTESDPCSFCVFQKKCKKGSGNGYGYKNQASRAFTSTKLRANILGVSQDMVTHNSVMVVDEYNQSVPWIEELEINFQDFKDSIFYLTMTTDSQAHLKAIQLLKEIAYLLILSMPKASREKYRAFVPSELLEREQISFYGESFQFIKDRISEVTEEDIKHSVEFIESQIALYNEKTLKSAIKKKKSLISTSLLLQKNWLKTVADLVSGVNNNGAMRILEGALIVSTRHKRMLDIFQSSYGVVYQDATGSKLDLALKLGIDESEILVVRKKFDKPDNVIVNQVTGFGKASSLRSDELKERVYHFKEKVSQLHDGNVGFIEFKKHKAPGNLTHFVDARGSNEFKTKAAVASIGVPCSNLSSKLSEFQCYVGKSCSLDDKKFQAFVSKEISSELVQEVGRLRANRRKDEQLTYYLAGDCDLTFLHQLGFQINEVKSVDFYYECGSNVDKALKVIQEVIVNSGDDVRQKDVTEATNISQRKLSYYASKFGGWSELKVALKQSFDIKGKEYQPVDDYDYIQKLSHEVVSNNLQQIFREELEAELLKGVDQPTSEIKKAIFNRLLQADRMQLLREIISHLPKNK